MAVSSSGGIAAVRARRWLPPTIRGRLTVLFAAGSTVALVAVLTLVYVLTTQQLRSAVDDGLRNRARTIAVAAAQGNRLVVDQDPYAQVLDSRGRLVAASPAAPSEPVLNQGQTLIAANRTLDYEGKVPSLGGNARVLAVPVPELGQVVVVGTSMSTVDQARYRMLVVLALATPLLVLALTLAARRVVGAALRPVAAMTAEAAEVSATGTERGLPVPDGEDEIARLARTLNDMLERLHLAFERERAFVDDASHELRTPVTVLRGELELGLGSHDPDEMRRSLDAAHREAIRLGALASDLLVLARERAGTLDAGTEQVDVAGHAIRALRPLGETLDVDVQVTTEPDGSAPRAVTDPVRLEQVWTNLVTNAGQAGARHLLVLVADRPGTNSVQVQVCDDGPGFPDGLLGHAFERFTRGDTARTRSSGGGAGLGLPIVAAIVRAQGGQLSADNGSPLGGARVTLIIPRAS